MIQLTDDEAKFVLEALRLCRQMLNARDEMNAAVHGKPTRLSPITLNVIQAATIMGRRTKGGMTE